MLLWNKSTHTELIDFIQTQLAVVFINKLREAGMWQVSERFLWMYGGQMIGLFTLLMKVNFSHL